MGLALGMNLTFYTSVAKGLRLKVRRFLGLVPTFVEVTEEKLVQRAFLPPTILNSVKANLLLLKFEMQIKNREYLKA